MPAWLDDPRYRLNAERMRHSRQSAACYGRDLPYPAIGEALNHPQTLARGMVVEVMEEVEVVEQEHARAGSIKTLGPSVQRSETPAQYLRPTMGVWRAGPRHDKLAGRHQPGSPWIRWSFAEPASRTLPPSARLP